jgi:hypothetical protein
MMPCQAQFQLSSALANKLFEPGFVRISASKQESAPAPRKSKSAQSLAPASGLRRGMAQPLHTISNLKQAY